MTRDDAWYRYGDGFIYQVDPYSRRIEAPAIRSMAGYDYMIGEPWPVAYPGYNVPLGYQPLYYDTPGYHYRYANGGIYQVDPTTQVIQALVALVSGQQFAVGQPLPWVMPSTTCRSPIATATMTAMTHGIAMPTATLSSRSVQRDDRGLGSNLRLIEHPLG